MSETSYLNHSSSEISIIEGTKNELIVFNSDNDKDSFLELLKLNNQNNGRTLVTLNYNENTGSFVERFKNYDGKIFLCLTGDDDGNRSTQKILNEFQNKSRHLAIKILAELMTMTSIIHYDELTNGS